MLWNDQIRAQVLRHICFTLPLFQAIQAETSFTHQSHTRIRKDVRAVQLTVSNGLIQAIRE